MYVDESKKSKPVDYGTGEYRDVYRRVRSDYQRYMVYVRKSKVIQTGKLEELKKYHLVSRYLNELIERDMYRAEKGQICLQMLSEAKEKRRI